MILFLLPLIIALLNSFILCMNDIQKHSNTPNDYSIQKILLTKALIYAKPTCSEKKKFYRWLKAVKDIKSFTDDSQEFVTAKGKTLSVWHKNTIEPLLRIKTPTKIISFTTTKDKKIIANYEPQTAMASLVCYEAYTGDIIFKINRGKIEATNIAYSDSLRQCAVLGNNWHGIDIYSFNEKYEVKKKLVYIEHGGIVSWDSTGKQLITGYQVELFHSNGFYGSYGSYTGTRKVEGDNKIYIHSHTFKNKKSFDPTIKTKFCNISVSNKNMIAACFDKKIDIYDMHKEALITTLNHDSYPFGFSSIKFDHTGRFLATVETMNSRLLKDTIITIWDLNSFTKIGSIELTNPVRSIEWIDNGKSIIVAHGQNSSDPYVGNTQDKLVRYDLTYVLSEDFFGKDNEIVVRATTEGTEIEKLNK